MVSKLAHPLSLKDVRFKTGFWHDYQELVRTQVIPYQWEALNDNVADAEPSHCIHNFRVAAGLEDGEFYGEFFQDSDLYKWMEATAYSLTWHPDANLQSKLESVIDLIEAAQMSDGYVNTYYQLKAGVDKRFTNLRSHHELYCMGHMIEAAIAHYQATGSDRFLRIAEKMANCAAANIGPESGKIHGYPGHEIAEMALIALYNITGDERHKKLAKYFVDQRGQLPLFFKEEGEKYGNPFRWDDCSLGYQYYQAGKPVLQQTQPEGHAVRAVYLYSGVAEVAAATNNEVLLDVCRQAFKSLMTRRMYVTGGIGSSEHGECFTFDYDLPNDTAYCETCASAGLIFFARRMFEITGESTYLDVLERALYNGLISGMALDGKRFFYVNPLETDPLACEIDFNKRHVKAERQKWFACACCPPNLARLISSLGNYAYALSDDTVYVNLFAAGSADFEVGGKRQTLNVETDYPWDGQVRVRVANESETAFKLALRIPGWCESFTLAINGEIMPATGESGFVTIDGSWQAGDEVVLDLAMPAHYVRANPRVRDDARKVCVMRGPLVYCAEEVDNGAYLQELRLDPTQDLLVEREISVLGDTCAITTIGSRASEASWEDALYQPWTPEELDTQAVRFVPYYTWGNRGLGEMSVWVYER